MYLLNQYYEITKWGGQQQVCISDLFYKQDYKNKPQTA